MPDRPDDQGTTPVVPSRNSTVGVTVGVGCEARQGIDMSGWLHEHLEQVSPDLLRTMGGYELAEWR